MATEKGHLVTRNVVKQILKNKYDVSTMQNNLPVNLQSNVTVNKYAPTTGFELSFGQEGGAWFAYTSKGYYSDLSNNLTIISADWWGIEIPTGDVTKEYYLSTGMIDSDDYLVLTEAYDERFTWSQGGVKVPLYKIGFIRLAPKRDGSTAIVPIIKEDMRNTPRNLPRGNFDLLNVQIDGTNVSTWVDGGKVKVKNHGFANYGGMNVKYDSPITFDAGESSVYLYAKIVTSSSAYITIVYATEFLQDEVTTSTVYMLLYAFTKRNIDIRDNPATTENEEETIETVDVHDLRFVPVI